MNLSYNTSGSLYSKSLFPKSLRHKKLSNSFNRAQSTIFANFTVNKHPSISEVICCCRSTYEGCDLIPLVNSSIEDSELILHF